VNNDNGSPSSRAGGPASTPPTGAGRTAFDWPRDTGTTDAVLQEVALEVRSLRRRRRRLLGVASGLAVLLIGGWTWQLSSRSPSPEKTASSAVVSAPAQQRLADGSVVWLRPGAEITVDFSPSLRRVELKKGEALFEVAKNPARPFVVGAAGIDVRAVGTAFTVNVKPAAVEVLVTHGEVAVEKPRAVTAGPASAVGMSAGQAPAEPGETFARLTAGNSIEVVTAPRLAASGVTSISSAEMKDRLSWRIPKLHFSRTPLVEVVALFNRHSTVRLQLGDEALGRLQLSGVIRADNTDALLQLLASDYGVDSERLRENEIVLRKSP
jgi:transmembrane sensor